eukprot:TRINITY_DN18534_c0_g1_i1.p1 TRINITY_DN18534_c0_g1~~TRINITY_DN18534_c0_g1_i1.p1  ORF type:complete len:544 (+),score=126.34 TRINITY_DN18534_c0_g1_i1:79-1632(+)
MADHQQQPSEGSDFKIVSRVTHSAVFGHVLGYSRHYYEAAKSLPGVHAGLEKLELGVKQLAPRIDPVLASVSQSKHLHDWDEHLSAKLDLAGKKFVESKQKVDDLKQTTLAYAEAGRTKFIAQPVDAISNTVSGLKNTTLALAEVGRVKYIAEPVDALVHKAEVLKQSTIAFAEAGKNKFIVEPASKVLEVSIQTLEGPVNSYLQHSVLASPLNKAIDIGEQLCDRYLPTDYAQVNGELDTASAGSSDSDVDSISDVANGWHEEHEVHPEEGPILRAGKLSKKFQRQAFRKLKGLNLRDTTTQPLRHCVDLIQYAANNFGSAAHNVVDVAIVNSAAVVAVGVSTAQNAGTHVITRAKPVVKKARSVASNIASKSSVVIAETLQYAAGVPTTLYIQYSDHPLVRSAYAQIIIDRIRSIQQDVTGRSPVSRVQLKHFIKVASYAALGRIQRLHAAEEEAISAFPALAARQKKLTETTQRLAEPIVQAIVVMYRRLSVDSGTSTEELAVDDAGKEELHAE